MQRQRKTLSCWGAWGIAMALGLYAGPITISPASADPRAVQGAVRSDSKVKVTASAEKPGADGKQVITLTLAIEKGWHIYTNTLPPDFAGVATTVTVESVKPEDVKIEYPEGKLVKSSEGDYTIYEDKAVIKATVTRPRDSTTPLQINVKVQACSDKSCLQPGTVKVTVP